MFVLTGIIRGSIMHLVYTKGLRLPAHHKGFSVGEVLNHMQVDAQNVANAVFTLGELATAPLSLALALYLLYNQVGASMAMAPLVIVASIPLMGFIANKMFVVRKKSLEQTDLRVKATSEAVLGVKTLKVSPSLSHCAPGCRSY